MNVRQSISLNFNPRCIYLSPSECQGRTSLNMVTHDTPMATRLIKIPEHRHRGRAVYVSSYSVSMWEADEQCVQKRQDKIGGGGGGR